MVSLQTQPTLDLFQFMSRLFHDLKQTVYESTLWVSDHGASQPFSIDLQETGTLLILKIQLQDFKGSIDLQITPETVLVKGGRLNSLETPDDSMPEFPSFRFQSLIPLPSSIQPQTAIAESNDTTLTLTLMKSYEAQRTVKITVDDRGQRLPYAMAANAELVAASARFN